MSRPILTNFLMASLILLSSGKIAQGQPDTDRGDTADSLVLNGDVELRALVDLAAERLDLNVEYDRSALRGQVTFRLGEPLADAELWNLTNRLLASRGYITIRQAGESTLSVVSMGDAADLAELEEIEEIGRTGAEHRPPPPSCPAFAS